MPIVLHYSDMFADIFIGGGIVFVYIAIFTYRLLASALFPRLCRWERYCLFCLIVLAFAPLALPFSDGGGVEGVFALLIITVPPIVLGAIELISKWRWYEVLISCMLETLLFPLWVILVVVVALVFGGAD